MFPLLFAALAGPQSIAAQVYSPRLEQGLSLYRAGYWADAVTELRRSQTEAAHVGEAAEALYWLSVTEFYLGDYEAALRDMDELQRIAPAGLRIEDMLYYKGRSLYYLKRYEEALTVFRLYETFLTRSKIDSPQARAQKATLAYWMGECLYSLGRQEQAAEFFAAVMGAKPRVEQYVAASHRLEMIRQKALQLEILGMLDWSYSEYLRLAEESQNRETAFNEAIATYQKQMEDAAANAAYMFELEAKAAEYHRLLSEAEERIRTLEARLSETQTVPAAPLAFYQEDTARRIRELKAEAEKLRNSLMPQ
jgi:tetratricopeptide (TPR) repeat protein